MMDIPKVKIGRLAEQEACDFLLKQGLQLIIQNYRGPQGEIDLIMQDGDDRVFVEVRKRNRSDFGDAIESVSYQKQQKIIHTALRYLQSINGLDNIACRFDIIGIQQNKIEWIKDAFTMNDNDYE